MSSPSSGYNSNDIKDFGQHLIRPRQRSRTQSLITVSSSTSFRSTLEITKTLSPSPTVCSRPVVDQAYGSFIPVRSATKCLRNFTGDHTTIHPRTPKKRRRVTFQETSSPVSSDDDDLPLPIYHNRPFPTPKKAYQNPPRSSSAIKKTSHETSLDMHPILAKLERESKFCSQMVYCSTCGKTGHDYPRCGKCGVMWCSRTCRLVAGKRHICPPIH